MTPVTRAVSYIESLGRDQHSPSVNTSRHTACAHIPHAVEEKQVIVAFFDGDGAEPVTAPRCPPQGGAQCSRGRTHRCYTPGSVWPVPVIPAFTGVRQEEEQKFKVSLGYKVSPCHTHSLTYTHSHTHSLTYTHACTHSHTCVRTHKHTHSHTNNNFHSDICYE